MTLAGIQQMGVGVADAAAAFAWYRRHFGFDVRIFDDTGEAKLMRRYTGDAVHRRRAIFALNMAGGGGLEIWQFLDRTSQAPHFEPELGDCGIFSTRLKTSDARRAAALFSRDLQHDPLGVPFFVLRDPWGNLFEIAERDGVFAKTHHPIGGVIGATLGVTDMHRSMQFYRDGLGYDRVLFDRVEGDVRTVRLSRTAPNCGPFSRLLGATELDLVHVRGRSPRRIYEGRYWGDLGFIHVCFDVHGCELPATVDSANSFDMGEAAGRFRYIEDPDGTLIELVETHKVPILKKLGLSIDLRKRPPDKPLPDWLVRGLAFNRVKD
jgi:catechol 2,3-dioxygenase-like lactoylglutathione lyase family enzyme